VIAEVEMRSLVAQEYMPRRFVCAGHDCRPDTIIPDGLGQVHRGTSCRASSRPRVWRSSSRQEREHGSIDPATRFSTSPTPSSSRACLIDHPEIAPCWCAANRRGPPDRRGDRPTRSSTPRACAWLRCRSRLTASWQAMAVTAAAVVNQAVPGCRPVRLRWEHVEEAVPF